ncbi:hypothetical protein LPB72_00290 [Hydrogenophaga crassostreae]|uniref:Uncharacterized protein n=1 Tax=Hydrogenophaga crassostreae TaxID=1763535 RepID=A0A163CP81_9BURK|nr:hypothetical protein LPB072_15525 [Hydrogenophaga crassostreae]OAD44001.1 hypothetical protein LPB72_00290 [Hydrogenophaga crassostreae]
MAKAKKTVASFKEGPMSMYCVAIGGYELPPHPVSCGLGCQGDDIARVCMMHLSDETRTGAVLRWRRPTGAEGRLQV